MLDVIPAQAMLKRKRRCWRVKGPRILRGSTEYSSLFFGRGQPEVVFAMAKAAVVGNVESGGFVKSCNDRLCVSVGWCR